MKEGKLQESWWATINRCLVRIRGQKEEIGRRNEEIINIGRLKEKVRGRRREVKRRIWWNCVIKREYY